MRTKHLFLIILLLIIGCRQNSVALEQVSTKTLVAQKDVSAEPLVAQEDVSAETQKLEQESDLDKQLKINRDALLKGSSEQMRIDAANVMLFDDNPQARRILIETLKQTENDAAQAAVCKALNQARQNDRYKNIKTKEAFINPLLGILGTSESQIAKLAAEATLIFDYQQISVPLERLASDTSLPAGARLNAVYALKLRHNIEAISMLINLLDDSDKKVKSAAQKALTELGVTIPDDQKQRQVLIEQLQNKGKEQFLQDLLIHQEVKVDKLREEVAEWRSRYLSTLDKYYNSLTDDKVRVSFLAEHLTDSKVDIELWALEKVSQWRVGTSSKLPAEFSPVLVSLISNPQKAVRLKVAQLLSLMGELSSAEKLLQQLKIEQDDEVKQELFVALGAACQYAFSPNSGKNVAPQIRKQTLELAGEYLFEQDSVKARNGAEVIKKLLKQDGLSKPEVSKYLDLIVKRYEPVAPAAESGSLRTDLLNSMAELCVQGVSCLDLAREKFKPIFEEAVKNESALVRQAGVTGLIYIDKAGAFKTLRKDFVNDNSAVIRQKLINLAGEMGIREDLTWLSEKTKTEAEKKIAWQSMMSIFKRSDISVLKEWMQKFNRNQEQIELSNQQLLPFFELVEQKLQTAEEPQMLKEVREKLAFLYNETGSLERAAEYFGLLLQKTDSSKEKQHYRDELLNLYLRGRKVKNATDLVHNYLLENRLEPNDVIVRSVTAYLNNPPEGIDPNEFLKEFSEVEIPDARPKWQAQRRQWRQMFTVSNEPNAPK